MGNKEYDTYRRVLNVINGYMNGIAPTSIIMDFEQGIIFIISFFWSLFILAPKRAFTELFPNVRIKLCLFHLGQSILRRVQVFIIILQILCYNKRI